MSQFSIFVASVLFLAYVGYRRRVGIFSMYSAFGLFHVLYNTVPWFVYMNDLHIFSLHADRETNITQLWMSSISSVCFGAVYLLFYKRTRFAALPSFPESMRRHYFLLSVPVFILAYFLAAKYGWRVYTQADGGEMEGGGVMFTVAAYVKFWCIGIYLYYLYKFGLDKWAWSLLGLHVVLLVIDNARLTFLPILLLTLILFSASQEGKRQRKIYVLAFLGIALSIFVRAVLSPDPSDRVRQATAPILVEGDLGDYPALQSIYILRYVGWPSIQYGATYVLDPLAWMVPAGQARDSLSHLHEYTDANSRYLVEKYAPWGGYYYLAEAVLNFGYLGPFLVTTAFAFSLIYIERNKNKMRMLYFAFVPTMGILFIKSIFGSVVKLFVIQLIVLATYRGLSSLNRLAMASTKRTDDVAGAGISYPNVPYRG